MREIKSERARERERNDNELTLKSYLYTISRCNNCIMVGI